VQIFEWVRVKIMDLRLALCSVRVRVSARFMVSFCHFQVQKIGRFPRPHIHILPVAITFRINALGLLVVYFNSVIVSYIKLLFYSLVLSTATGTAMLSSDQACLRQHVPVLISVDRRQDSLYGQQCCPDICPGMF